MSLIYLLFSVRYFPDQLSNTILSTINMIIKTGFFAIGLTIIIASILTKIAGKRPPTEVVIKIFLACGIIVGLFISLNDHLSWNQ